MGRQIVMQRKGGVPHPGADERISDRNSNTPSTPAEATDDSAQDGQDVAECPNCGCQFDDETGDVVKPGAKVVASKGSDAPEGVDLPLPDQPVAGRMGAGHDAAFGDAVLANALANLHTKVR